MEKRAEGSADSRCISYCNAYDDCDSLITLLPAPVLRCYVKLSPAQQQLVSDNYGTIDRLAAGTVARCVPTGVQRSIGRDDLLQEARVAGAKAVVKWRPDGGASLKTYIVNGIRKRLLAVMARHAPLMQLPEEFDREQDAPRPEPVELWALTAALRRGLTMLQRLVVYLFAVERLPQREIAAAIGRDRGYVSAALQAAKIQIANNRIDRPESCCIS